MTAMKRASITCLFAVTIAAAAGVASAQDEGKVGLTMGYPSAIGVLWHVTDRVAVRPEFTWSLSSTQTLTLDDIAGTFEGSPTDTWQAGVGLSGLFYLTKLDGLRTYVTPRFAYSQVSAGLGGSTLTAASSASKSYTWSGSFGAEYSLGRHFGLFGEFGLSYATTTATTIQIVTIGVAPSRLPGALPNVFSTRVDIRGTTFGTRSGAGVIFFF